LFRIREITGGVVAEVLCPEIVTVLAVISYVQLIRGFSSPSTPMH
jgi:hypothetical protein